MALDVEPAKNPLAFSVVVVVMDTGVPAYAVDDAVGSFPFVVYRIVAPLVAHVMLTNTDPEYVPGAGVN
jgi:hypothetical protein